MPHLAHKLQRSLLPSGSSKSIGRRPHRGNTTLHARNSIHGGHHSDHDSNSRRFPGDRSLQPSMLRDLLPLMQRDLPPLMQWSSPQAPTMLLLLPLGLVDLAQGLMKIVGWNERLAPEIWEKIAVWFSVVFVQWRQLNAILPAKL